MEPQVFALSFEQENYNWWTDWDVPGVVLTHTYGALIQTVGEENLLLNYWLAAYTVAKREEGR